MGTKVLIIDDDVAFKRLLELRLKSFMPDLELTTFDLLEPARKHLASPSASGYDLVILDEHLPDGRGHDFLKEGWFEGDLVLSVSSDSDPEIPGAAISAGAAFFLNKTHVSQPLFKPLVVGLIDRNRINRQLVLARHNQGVMEAVKTLVGTLKHEINNPLGAVLGAAYLLKTAQDANPETKNAASLVEDSGKRIKHVLDQLCEAIALDYVSKADHKVFHIPGDQPWRGKA